MRLIRYYPRFLRQGDGGKRKREKRMEYLRVKKQADFQKLFSKGRRAFSPSLTMICMPSPQTRMGISVGKRHGKSVQRNRIKRLLRDAFRAELKEMKGTWTIVLVPKVRDEYELSTFRKHLKCMIKKEKL